MIWLRPRAYGNTKYHAFRIKKQWELSLCRKWYYTYDFAWEKSNYYTENEDPWFESKKRCLRCQKIWRCNNETDEVTIPTGSQES